MFFRTRCKISTVGLPEAPFLSAVYRSQRSARVRLRAPFLRDSHFRFRRIRIRSHWRLTWRQPDHRQTSEMQTKKSSDSGIPCLNSTLLKIDASQQPLADFGLTECRHWVWQCWHLCLQLLLVRSCWPVCLNNCWTWLVTGRVPEPKTNTRYQR